MKRIYLDHAAATPVTPLAQSAMQPYFSEDFANPSAIHKEGVAARIAVDGARKQIAAMLRVQPSEIIFTGSATESANLAILGAVRAWKKQHPTQTPHVIISAIEHEAVFGPARALEAEGVRLSILPVSADGIVKLDELSTMITFDTVVIAVMYANNEIGTIEPIGETAKIIRKWKKEERGVVRGERPTLDDQYPLLYSDASQAPNYLECIPASLGVDMMTLSSAKVYGPKGSGLLFCARGTNMDPILHGGGQERGFRPGTENVSAIIGFQEALHQASQMRAEETERLTQIRDVTVTLLKETFPLITVNGSLEHRLANNINFSFPDIDHEFLALALDARGFSVATKSACSETEAEISHVLLALKQEEHETRPVSGIRISMGRGTTLEAMQEFVAVLREIMDTMMVPV